MYMIEALTSELFSYTDYLNTLPDSESQVLLEDLHRLNEMGIWNILEELDQWITLQRSGSIADTSPRMINVGLLMDEIFSEKELQDLKYIQSRYSIMNHEYTAVRAGQVWWYPSKSFAHHYDIYNSDGILIASAMVSGLPDLKLSPDQAAELDRRLWEELDVAQNQDN